MKKLMYIVLSLVLVLMLTAAAVGFLGYRWLFTVSADQVVDRSFDIGGGESFTSVSMRLENRGLIPSGLALQLFARFTGNDRGIQKGAYILPEELSPVAILDYLSSGRQTLQRITIPEGKTLRQVSLIFEDAGIVNAQEFLDAATNAEIIDRYNIPSVTMEGYLFPETYYFANDYPAEKIVTHMADTFFVELEKIYPEYDTLHPEELHETITLASIVEREYLAIDEAPYMASVFYNRLEQGMMLESCATVVYVMTEEEGLEHPSRIFFSDLRRESEYNTYINNGLPPTPISGISRHALDAAFYPVETDYLFFVLESPSAGRHVFSENYSDHLTASEFYYVKLN